MTPATSAKAEAKPVETKHTTRNPWWWVPSLYFSQGIPYVIVMTMSVVMYFRLGISTTDIALYTSWLYLPWVIKPLWSPLVDITRTKRFWVVSMQFLVSFGLALVAFSVQGSAFFKWSLFLFWIMAFASSTHDIAADGFYMLALTKHEQAWWVGLRSTFYRTAMIVGSGLLVVLAGVLESKNGLPPVAIPVQASATAPVVSAWDPATVKLAAADGDLRVVVQPASLDIALAGRTAEEAKAVITQAKAWNRQHRFIAEENPVKAKPAATNWWSVYVSGPLGGFLTNHFPKPPRIQATDTPAAGNIGVIYLSLSKAPPADQQVAVNFGRKPRGIEYIGFGKSDRGFRLVEGERFVFNSDNWNQPAMAVIQLDPKLKTDTAVTFVTSSGNIPLAWSITLFFVAGIFLAFSCWHSIMLPRPAADGPVKTHHSLLGEFFATLGSFFQKPGVLLAMAFILLYRFDEAQLVKVISPFLLDAREAGGLGLTTSQVGLVYGTFGILALTFGGLLGGFTAAKHGLKKMLPIMVASMYLPKLAFVFLSWTQPSSFLVACAAVALEQFGYGFGFTAFMLYMLFFADGPHKTAHYAICTGFMALGMMIPGFWSGWVADLVGYKHFFVWVICSAVPGFVLAMVLNRKIDPNFGKKTG
ncbi:MAG TPA: MFS transporter [Candidatus Paceibacterota bacterium]|nr:MFS transporter [Verrucomicrobiota bacterium]HSA12451.1 MFS transporter [Candidatus Paceibacterota bacterium]